MIYIIDAITGSGKSSWAIQNIIKKIKQGEKILYVTPYLSEIKRIKEECKKHKIKLEEPDITRGKGSKSFDLQNLLSRGKNIVTTHVCFDRVSKEFLHTLIQSEYTLYMDEVHEVVKQYSLSDDDINMLIQNKYIKIDTDTKLVKWISNSYDGRFIDFKNLCEIGSIYCLGNKMYMWTFPHTIFNIMKDTYILTYLFKGQNQCMYYDMYNLPYKMLTILNENSELKGMNGKYKVVDYDLKYYLNDILQIKHLINIYDGKLNLNENLSSYKLKNSTEQDLKIIRNNILNYFKHIIHGKSNENMWTTLLEFKDVLKGTGYTKGFIEITARATNEFSHKVNLVYAYDRFMNPIIYNFFKERGYTPNQDLYSASEIIQWVFRSAVRNGKSINLYIPSKRMRTIFYQWLNGDLYPI